MTLVNFTEKNYMTFKETKENQTENIAYFEFKDTEILRGKIKKGNDVKIKNKLDGFSWSGEVFKVCGDVGFEMYIY